MFKTVLCSKCKTAADLARRKRVAMQTYHRSASSAFNSAISGLSYLLKHSKFPSGRRISQLIEKVATGLAMYRDSPFRQSFIFVCTLVPVRGARLFILAFPLARVIYRRSMMGELPVMEGTGITIRFRSFEDPKWPGIGCDFGSGAWSTVGEPITVASAAREVTDGSAPGAKRICFKTESTVWESAIVLLDEPGEARQDELIDLTANDCSACSAAPPDDNHIVPVIVPD